MDSQAPDLTTPPPATPPSVVVPPAPAPVAAPVKRARSLPTWAFVFLLIALAIAGFVIGSKLGGTNTEPTMIIVPSANGG